MRDTVWTFRTARFTIVLQVEPEYGYQYDGDDSDGETQAALDSGELVAFNSIVRIFAHTDNGPVEVGSDSLGDSVYAADSVDKFWTAHRDPDPMNRNCSIMRAARGGNVCIGHYFPDMVAQAIAEARRTLADIPTLRAA